MFYENRHITHLIFGNGVWWSVFFITISVPRPKKLGNLAHGDVKIGTQVFIESKCRLVWVIFQSVYELKSFVRKK